MLIVRLLWVCAVLPVIAAGVYYISDPSTAAWYVYIVAAVPLVVLLFLRVMAIQKGRGEPFTGPGPGGGWGGSGPYGPP